jgi:hypothetical protein
MTAGLRESERPTRHGHNPEPIQRRRSRSRTGVSRCQDVATLAGGDR